MGRALLWLALVCLGGGASAQEANVLPNPSFELTEPPPPTAAGEAPQGAWLPRTWSAWVDGGAIWKCPDDASQAHSGTRCAHFDATQGAGHLRYGPMPVPPDKPWTLRFFARGTGRLVASAYNVLPDKWDLLPTNWPFDLTAEWQPFEFTFEPGPACTQWVLDLSTQGPTVAWLDDVEVTYPGLPDLRLPPDAPLARDEHTLLYLPFEEPLNEDAFFIKGQTRLSEPDQGRFGRSLVLGAEGYTACSANENLDCRQGTIEVWVKFLTPGDDGVYHNIVGVPGPEGMMLAKDQYSHMHFGFSSGWAPLAFATAMGYAGSWQPGVWRHLAACWDKDLIQLFVDGKLIAWKRPDRLSRALGPELGIGSEGMALDDLRISDVVRYRLPVP